MEPIVRQPRGATNDGGDRYRPAQGFPHGNRYRSRHLGVSQHIAGDPPRRRRLRSGEVSGGGHRRGIQAQRAVRQCHQDALLVTTQAQRSRWRNTRHVATRRGGLEQQPAGQPGASRPAACWPPSAGTSPPAAGACSNSPCLARGASWRASTSSSTPSTSRGRRRRPGHLLPAVVDTRISQASCAPITGQ